MLKLKFEVLESFCEDFLRVLNHVCHGCIYSELTIVTLGCVVFGGGAAPHERLRVVWHPDDFREVEPAKRCANEDVLEAVTSVKECFNNALNDAGDKLDLLVDQELALHFDV